MKEKLCFMGRGRDTVRINSGNGCDEAEGLECIGR